MSAKPAFALRLPPVRSLWLIGVDLGTDSHSFFAPLGMPRRFEPFTFLRCWPTPDAPAAVIATQVDGEWAVCNAMKGESLSAVRRGTSERFGDQPRRRRGRSDRS